VNVTVDATHECLNAITTAEKEAIDGVMAKQPGPKGDVWDIERSICDHEVMSYYLLEHQLHSAFPS
jgi:hypothetical protein